MRQRRYRILGGAVAFLVGGSSVWADGLSQVPPLAGYSSSAGRGIVISPGGNPVVVGSVPEIDSVTPSEKGFVWNPTINGALPKIITANSGWGDLTLATGVGYRSVAGSPQLVANGLNNGWDATFTSDNDGDTWAQGTRLTNYTKTVLGVCNTLGALGADDSFYFTWTNDTGSGATSNWDVRVGQGTGNPPTAAVVVKGISKPATAGMLGCSGTGLAVGWRNTDGTTATRQNYKYAYVGGAGFYNGLDGTQSGQGWTVSGDGTRVFGTSPVTGGRTGAWPYMVPVTAGVFGAAVELPTFPDTGGSATNAVPYGATADGKYVVGMNYRGSEKAVLWNLSDPNPANWTVTDLTDYFTTAGMLAPAGYSKIIRAYSVVKHGSDLWITGFGVLANDQTSRRAFVAVIGPSTINLTFGACCGPTSCSYVLESSCTNGTFQANVICANAGCPGACCKPNGTCATESQSACTADSGVYRGAYVDCSGACTGACCGGAASCQDNVAYGICPTTDFKGFGTTCATSACPCSSSNRLWADADLDGDVDGNDFAIFQGCFTGGGTAPTPATDSCKCMDHVAGNGVQGDDLQQFQNCLTGANIPYNMSSLPTGPYGACTP